MNTASFLSLVLPDGGNFFVVEYKDDRMYHHLVPNAVEAANRAQWLDTRAEGNVYYAMASYKEPEYLDSKGKRRRRTQENVDKLKCFWIDMDCKGKANDYANQGDAVRDIKRLCGVTGLSLPTAVVNSGYGIHAYWVLDEAIEADVWNSVACRWRTTLEAIGIKHDSSCTTDSARILRPVGTRNRKAGNNDQKVRLVGPIRPVISLKTFTEHLIGTVASGLSLVTPQFSGVDLSLNDAATAGVEYQTSSIREVVKACGLLRAVGALGGNVSEPLWHKALGVVRYTTEAEKAIHIFSRGHPSYSPEETEAKSAAWNADGPPSCEILRRESLQEMPEHCRSCKHFGSIKGPIQLGHPKVLMVETVTVQTASGFIETSVEVESLPLTMHNKFKWENGKLWHNTLDKDATKEQKKEIFEWFPFCDFLFYPSSYYNDADEKQQTVWTLREREGCFKEFQITGGALGSGGQALFKELGERGITASTGGGKPHMEAYITTWANEIKKSKTGIETYMHFGWHGDKFLHGTTMCLPDGSLEEVRVSKDAARMTKYLTPTGDLARWKELVNEAYNHNHMEQFQFIMGAGFGSILMPFMNVGGGATISAVSYTTGQGKTTAMRNAFGIYGCPDENTPVTLSRSSTTYNGIFAIAGLLHNFPVLLDETTNIEGGQLSDIVYTWSQGQPKIRLRGSGELATVGDGWSGFLLSSSNKPMTSIIAGAKPGADAELARLIEFDCTSTHKLHKERADRVFSELREHYGVAGREYVRWVVSNTDEVKKLLRDTQTMLDRRLELSGQSRYWSAGYTATLVGLIIAKRLGLVQFDLKGVMLWIEAHVKEMRGEIAANVSTPTELFGRMLNDVSQGMLVTDIEGGRGSGGKEPYIVKEPKGQYTGRAILQTGLGYLAQPAIHKWCTEFQVDMKAVMQAGFDAGWVLALQPEKRYPGKGTNFAMGQVRCFALDLARLENSTQTAPMLAEVVKMMNKGGK